MKSICALLIFAGLATPAFGQVIGGLTPIVTSNPTISTLTTGVVLEAGGSVSADGRYVTMTIQPSFSSLEGFQTFDFSGTSVAGGAAGTRAVGIASLPFRPAQVGNVTFVDTDKKLLAAPVPAMTLKAVSFKEAAHRVAVAAKINVALGLRGFEQAGVKVNEPRDFAIAAGPVKDVLLAMLKIAAPDTDVVITAEEGVVQVATQAQGDNAVVTRTYYLEDLLANLPRIVSNQTDLDTLKTKAHDKNAAEKMAEGSGPLPPAVGGPGTRRPAAQRGIVPTGADSATPAAAEAPRISTSIQEIITSTVRPEIWKVNGGKIGEISVVGDHVTVTAPESVQAILNGPKHYNPNAAPVYVTTGGL